MKQDLIAYRHYLEKLHQLEDKLKTYKRFQFWKVFSLTKTQKEIEQLSEEWEAYNKQHR